jgi:hypothetical protein
MLATQLFHSGVRPRHACCELQAPQTTTFVRPNPPISRQTRDTIKTESQKGKVFAIVGRFFGSKNTGLFFHPFLPARLEVIYSAGGKICLKNYLLSKIPCHFEPRF